MAKLEDQVTPIELLNIIRGGTVKNDVLKEYRTTDQELAKMLLPLYRSGELSMEEFNDFFKGVPLTPKKPDDEAQGPSVPRPEDEAPSEILRSLSEDRGGKSAENSRKADAKPEPEPLAFPESSASPEPPMASVESAIVEEIQAEELFEEGELEEEFLEEPDIEVEGALQPEVDMKDLEAVLPPKAPCPCGRAAASCIASSASAGSPSTRRRSGKTRSRCGRDSFQRPGSRTKGAGRHPVKVVVDGRAARTNREALAKALRTEIAAGLARM